MKGLWMVIGKALVNETFRNIFNEPANPDDPITTGEPDQIPLKLVQYLQNNNIPCSRYVHGEINRLLVPSTDGDPKWESMETLIEFFNILGPINHESSEDTTIVNRHGAIGLGLIDESFVGQYVLNQNNDFLKTFDIELDNFPAENDIILRIFSNNDFVNYRSAFQQSWKRPVLQLEIPGACSSGVYWSPNYTHYHDFEAFKGNPEILAKFYPKPASLYQNAYVVFTDAKLI